LQPILKKTVRSPITKNEDHEYEEARETRLNDEEIALDDCDGRCFSCDDFDGNGCGRRIEDDEV